ncbi:Xaa-Pro aminopeptidase [Moraxella caviae]|nr:aminopeptidase P family protein [Moraxella caviae]OOR93221.1 Xaa-Pro aminopeptidase [Moraxella caviae]
MKPVVNPTANPIVSRLQALRQAMTAHGIDVLIIPTADPHLSEYIPAHYQAREYFSGFTGSMGTLVVGADFAHLWADSRYWEQADIELGGTGIELQKLTANHNHIAYLAKHAADGMTVAVDGMVASVAECEKLAQQLAENNAKLVLDQDITALAWQDRPSLPKNAIYPHNPQFVNESTASKLAKVRAAMAQAGAEFHLISSLDDIGWLTNLRGSDVPFNPVFLAHLLIDAQQATLFVDLDKLDDTTTKYLTNHGIGVADYDDIHQAMACVRGRLLIDAAKVAQGVVQHAKDAVEIRQTNPSTLLKGVKSDKDLDCVRAAMRQDGAALCEFFAELEAKLAAGERISELDIDAMLTLARSRQPHYVSASFDTIAGFNAHGAIIHYRATPERFGYLDGDGLLLIDSGAQYENGTTDITRMAGIGQVSEAQKRDVTCVLKAHIALAMAHFPVGFASPKLDVLARAAMWQYGLDYGHGTGHGVGYFMNVHEGPQRIMHSAATTTDTQMYAGMITSNEPGLYRTGKWGVRIENLLACVPAASSEFGEFLKFEDLTLCPIDTRLLSFELLTDTEKHWLNAYHQKVHDALIDLVSGAAKAWLVARTQPI